MTLYYETDQNSRWFSQLLAEQLSEYRDTPPKAHFLMELLNIPEDEAVA